MLGLNVVEELIALTAPGRDDALEGGEVKADSTILESDGCIVIDAAGNQK